MSVYKVYRDEEYGHLYSKGVTRAFGENRMVKTYDFSDVFSSVMPLLCDPAECNLVDVGTINNKVESN